MKKNSILLIGVIFVINQVLAEEMSGKEIAFDRTLGNCLACHLIQGGDLTGNIAPPLIAMKARYPDKNKLREQIWDPTVRNPHVLMPPFGKHKILTEEQVDKVTDFIYSL